MAWWAFQNVVATAALALVVAMICRTPRMNPVVRHALWVLVLVKFITPPLMAWPWSAPDPLGIRTVDAQTVTPVSVTIDPAQQRGDSDRVIDAVLAAPLSDSGARANTDRPEPRVLTFAAVWPWLATIWILGGLFVLSVECTRLLRVARAVRAGRPADEAILDRVRLLAARLDLAPIPVLALSRTTAPAVWCFGRPRLLWPALLPADFTDACIDGLIVHELAHVKRRDHVVGWIELAASVIWWWNPLFWFVRSAMREQAELACDGWVVSALPNGRRAYAESLLALSSMVTPSDASPSPIAAVLGVRARSRRALERRLVMIMKGRASRQLSAFGLVGLAVMAAATLPVWATSSQQIPPPSPPAAPAAVPAPQRPPAPPTPILPTTAPPAIGSAAIAMPPQVPPPPPPAPGQPPPAAPAPPAPAMVATVPTSNYYWQTTPSRVALPTPVTVATPSGPTTLRVAPPAMGATTEPQNPPTTPPAPPQPARGIRVGPQGAVTTTQTPQPSRVTRVGPQGGVVTAPQTPRPAIAGGPMRGVIAPRLRAEAALQELPADAQTVAKKYDTEREAIQQEADKKIEAQRADLVKSLTALQEQYTKAGKLDEAVAIRDYIRELTSDSGIRRTVIRREDR